MLPAICGRMLRDTLLSLISCGYLLCLFCYVLFALMFARCCLLVSMRCHVLCFCFKRGRSVPPSAWPVRG